MTTISVLWGLIIISTFISIVIGISIIAYFYINRK